MKMRMNYREANPEAYKALASLERFVAGRGLDRRLCELIKVRASQLNGCAFCVDLHSRDLLKLGESAERLALLPVWREAPCFSESERAALELTECVTRLSETGVPLEAYENARKFFDEAGFVDLIMAINAINCWNRIAVSTGMFPGCYS
ncbi:MULTISPECIES: carboxymuconolactone decarboxylase family protein [Cohnella]|uniref:carboxymuconolactone decarboxylase family protein n=1 Tax=Cohnella TaxID=329857 RepID=UPI0009B9C478|nr:carboxymuconolactone decarboxylase family protein [Cohnella massiliensis]MBN2981255.1 carboxymuconolactone decarboxylase family protein [Cohnella algarum]